MVQGGVCDIECAWWQKPGRLTLWLPTKHDRCLYPATTAQRKNEFVWPEMVVIVSAFIALPYKVIQFIPSCHRDHVAELSTDYKGTILLTIVLE